MNLETFKHSILPAKDSLFRTAFYMLKNKEEAEDILQEAMLRLWKNKDKLDAYESVAAFATRVVKNLCIDRLKSKSYKSGASLETAFDLGGQQADPYQLTELGDSGKLMHRLFQDLPEQQRLIIQLRDVEEYSYEEIEEVTGLSVNTIRVNLSRARKIVREKYLKINNYETR